MAYRLPCCSHEFVQFSLHIGGFVCPDVGRIEVPVFSIDEGDAVLSFWVIERVALVEKTLSKRRSSTLFVLDFISQLQVREHDFA